MAQVLLYAVRNLKLLGEKMKNQNTVTALLSLLLCSSALAGSDLSESFLTKSLEFPKNRIKVYLSSNGEMTPKPPTYGGPACKITLRKKTDPNKGITLTPENDFKLKMVASVVDRYKELDNKKSDAHTVVFSFIPSSAIESVTCRNYRSWMFCGDSLIELRNSEIQNAVGENLNANILPPALEPVSEPDSKNSKRIGNIWYAKGITDLDTYCMDHRGYH